MDDDRWRGRALLALEVGEGREEWNEEQVELALREAAEAGVRAATLHGDPEAFARRCLAQREPAELAAVARDQEAGLWSAIVVSIGLFALIYAYSTVRDDGWLVTPDLRAAVLFVGLVILACGSAVASALRISGRPLASRRTSWALLGGVVAWSVGIATLPRGIGESVAVPSLLGPALVLAAAIVTWRWCDSLVTRRAGDWLDDLAARLVGRHDLPPDLARALANESRAHWEQASSSHPADSGPEAEFGDLDDYAAVLSVGKPVQPPLRRRLRPRFWRIVAPAVCLVTVLSVVDGSPWWYVACYGVFSVIAVNRARAEFRLHRGERPGAAP